MTSSTQSTTERTASYVDESVSIAIADFSIDRLPGSTFASFADSLPSPCWISTADGQIIWRNRAWNDYFGILSHTIDSWTCGAIHAPDVLPEAFRHWRAAVASATSLEMICPLQGADGLWRPFLTRIWPIKDGRGTVANWCGLLTHTSEPSLVEHSLRESEEKFQAFAEAVPNQVWSAYPDGRLEWLNARLYEYLGSDAIDPTSLRWDEAVHPDDFSVADPNWEETLAAGTLYESEYRLRRFDGVYRWHLTRAVPIRNDAGEITRWVGTNTDIDDNKAIAQSLTDLNRSLEQQVALRTADRDRLWANSQDILVVTDANGIYRAVSPAWTKVLGHEPAEVIGRSYVNFVHQQDVPMVLSAQEAGALDQAFAGFVTRHIHKTGDSRWIAWSSANEDGLIYATGRDITAEYMAKAELSQAQARIRTIFETTFQFQAYLSPDGALLDVNPAGLAVISEHRDDVIGHAFWQTAWFAQTPGLADEIEEAVTAARNGDRVQREIAINLPPLGVRYCDISIRPVKDAQEAVAGIIFEAMDLTDRRIAEQQLHQAQKMEAVGHLTGGLAHDFNNMLAIVISALKLLERHGATVDDQSQRFIDGAKDAAFRASTLTRRLLEFSRQQPLAPVLVNINTIISSMIALLHHAIGDRIRLTTRLADDLWPTHADTNQLENIVLNLAVNARDAMLGDGDLMISTANVTISDADTLSTDPRALPAGHYVTISVADNGCGMPPDVAARAFEPFFSTKEPGKGTGLGLSQVYGFVKRFGGEVRIQTEPDRGTTITLYLRRSQPAETPLKS